MCEYIPYLEKPPSSWGDLQAEWLKVENTLFSNLNLTVCMWTGRLKQCLLSLEAGLSLFQQGQPVYRIQLHIKPVSQMEMTCRRGPGPCAD